jgi:ribose transport system permease protein
MNDTVLKRFGRSFHRFRRTPAFTGAVLFVFAIILSIITQGPAGFFSLTTINTLFSKNAPLILVAMAQGLLLISGTLDISIGIQLALVNVIAIMLPQQTGVPEYVGWIAGIAAAMAASALCGLLVAVLRLPDLLASFSLIYIIKGVNVKIMPSPQGKVSEGLYKAYDSLLGGVIPVSAIIILVVFLLWIYIKKTRFGKHIYAVGINPRNAFAAGINPTATKMQAFLVKGVIVGIGGICLTLMTASGNPLQAEDYGMRSLAACIIGGLGFGGWGSLSCALFGAGFLVLIQNSAFNFFTKVLPALIPGFVANSYWQNLASDIIVFLGLLMTIVTTKGQREALKQVIVRQFKRGERIGK